MGFVGARVAVSGSAVSSHVFRLQVSVNQTGEFHCTFPEELAEVAQTELRALHRENTGKPLTIDKPRTN